MYTCIHVFLHLDFHTETSSLFLIYICSVLRSMQIVVPTFMVRSQLLSIVFWWKTCYINIIYLWQQNKISFNKLTFKIYWYQEKVYNYHQASLTLVAIFFKYGTFIPQKSFKNSNQRHDHFLRLTIVLGLLVQMCLQENIKGKRSKNIPRYYKKILTFSIYFARLFITGNIFQKN